MDYKSLAHSTWERKYHIVFSSKYRTKRLYSDKGYSSQENREFLKAQGIKDGIMYKAACERPLTHWQKVFNKLILKRRYRVEQAFSVP